MQIQRAKRNRVYMKIAVQGPSGSGKTYSSLLIANGLVDDYQNIVVIDSEAGSSHLYAHLGEYNIIILEDPFTPSAYVNAINSAIDFGAQCIIIDSLSHVWLNLLEVHAKMEGNSFTNWSKITPIQNKLIQFILKAPLHIIATLRVKQDYILQTNEKGKVVPEKVGLKPIQRNGIEYDFTVVFDLDTDHFARVSKDRTQLFSDAERFVITSETGSRIAHWCNHSDEVHTSIQSRLDNIKSLKELTDLYLENRGLFSQYRLLFENKKAELNGSDISSPNLNTNGQLNSN